MRSLRTMEARPWIEPRTAKEEQYYRRAQSGLELPRKLPKKTGNFEFPPSENLKNKEQGGMTDVRGPLDARGPFHKCWLKPMVLSKGACWICDSFEHLCLRSLRLSAVYREMFPGAI